jgi:hypothetical protein
MQTVMVERSKFVSIALAIMMFLSQAAAHSACWIPMPAMQEMGDAGMTASMPPAGIQQGQVIGSCCQLSAATSPSLSVSRAPEYGASSEATTSNTSILAVLDMAISVKRANARPRALRSSLQSTLCVFMI